MPPTGPRRSRPSAAPIGVSFLSGDPLIDGRYFLTVDGSGSGAFTCTVTAGTATAEIEVTFAPPDLEALSCSQTGYSSDPGNRNVVVCTVPYDGTAWLKAQRQNDSDSNVWGNTKDIASQDGEGTFYFTNSHPAGRFRFAWRGFTSTTDEWSDWIELDVADTRPPPGPVTGLKCSAATRDSVTVSWDGAVGADSFEVQSTGIVAVGLSDIFWEAGGSLSSGHPSIRRYVHTFDSPARGHLYLFGVRAVNGEGDGPEDTVKCRTRLSDMLSVECSDNALLAARFSDPFEGTGLAPTEYTAVITKAGSSVGSTTETQHKILVSTRAEHGAQYTVALTATYGTGWVEYTETDTVSCPAHTDNWNSPNFYDPDEDCNSDLPLVGYLANAVCRVGGSQILLAESYQDLYGLKPALIDTEPVLLSRSCDTTTTPNHRTCEETWTENIILLKNPGIDWAAIRIDDWSGPEDVILNLGTIISFSALVVSAPALSWVYFFAVAAAGVSTAGQVYGYLENAEGQEVLRLYGSTRPSWDVGF